MGGGDGSPVQRPHVSRGAVPGGVSIAADGVSPATDAVPVAAGGVPVAARSPPGDVRAEPVTPGSERSVKAARVVAPTGTTPDVPRYLAIRPSDRIA
ncbi:hypothetical protein GCM10010402_85820 [Actinomadura luteofluorescens]